MCGCERVSEDGQATRKNVTEVAVGCSTMAAESRASRYDCTSESENRPSSSVDWDTSRRGNERERYNWRRLTCLSLSL
ncbi:hypothetical protein BD410DRAFT_315115 [Rickenella mellea]|uniref:Uncharacterized protein n=1 Tax=Rickenella mellea TaxID=50990 RepID=A0A4Y7Q185_9AGAM|nr:hypothetical protein BD410DRAFT_315115 [Rickenella mellea]